MPTANYFDKNSSICFLFKELQRNINEFNETLIDIPALIEIVLRTFLISLFHKT